MVSIFFMLKIPPFLHLLLFVLLFVLLLLLLRIYSLHSRIKNKYCWHFFKIPLPRSLIFLKICFLKGLEDMSLNFLHKDRKPYECLWCMCEKQLQRYVTSLIDTILCNIFQLLIATLYFHH